MKQGTDPLSQVFAALAHPARRTMLASLAHGSATVGELAAPLAMSKPAVSQHLATLEAAGLIDRQIDGRWRRCSIRTDSLDEATEWIEQQRTAWQGRFDALDDLVRDLRQHTPDDQSPGDES